MRFTASYTDIQSLAHRIRSGELEVSPVLQTDRPWSKRRKQNLIDYILRGWETTGFCVAREAEAGKEWILVGSRPIGAVREFLEGSLPLNGQEQWCHPELRVLHGITYDDLPDTWRNKFKSYRLRILTVSDFHDDELEAFLGHFRQFPEKDLERDALGVVAGQINELAKRYDPRGTIRALFAVQRRRDEFIELLARALIILERRDLAARITSTDVSRFLVRERPANKTDIDTLAAALLLLDQTGTVVSAVFPKFSSATFLSWLLFLIRAQRLRLEPHTSTELGVFLDYFESCRQKAAARPTYAAFKPADVASLQLLFRIYKVTGSAPLNAVPSLILRDAIIWILYDEFLSTKRPESRLTEEMKLILRDAFLLSDELRERSKLAKRLIALGWAKI